MVQDDLPFPKSPKDRRKKKRPIYHFDGPTFIRYRDGKRLSTQLDRAREWALEWSLNQRATKGPDPMKWDWFTVEQCVRALGYPMGSMASIDAKLRDLRKPKFGRFLSLSRERSKGLWERLVIPPPMEDDAQELTSQPGVFK